MFYIAHFWCVLNNETDLAGMENNEKDKYSSWKRNRQKHYFFTFPVLTLLVPLALSFVSNFVGQNGVFNLYTDDPRTFVIMSAYYISRSVFILMITLEISYLYILTQSDWRALLLVAMILDLIAYCVFVAVDIPDANDPPRFWTVALMMVIGILSLFSSFQTIFRTWRFEEFRR